MATSTVPIPERPTLPTVETEARTVVPWCDNTGQPGATVVAVRHVRTPHLLRCRCLACGETWTTTVGGAA